jgi:hypothetical protein
MQGLWAGQRVAIKRVAIRTSADLDSFRQEVSLMAAATHPHIVPLLAARALPPGPHLGRAAAYGSAAIIGTVDRGSM